MPETVTVERIDTTLTTSASFTAASHFSRFELREGTTVLRRFTTTEIEVGITDAGGFGSGEFRCLLNPPTLSLGIAHWYATFAGLSGANPPKQLPNAGDRAAGVLCFSPPLGFGKTAEAAADAAKSALERLVRLNTGGISPGESLMLFTRARHAVRHAMSVQGI